MVGDGTIYGKRNPHKHQINLIKDIASTKPLGPLYRKAFELQDIIDRYPPRLSDRNKALVFSISSPPQSEHSGQVKFKHMLLPIVRSSGDSPRIMVM